MTADRQRFEKLIGLILQHEGGYVNDPRDAGGETKYGISKRSYPHEDIKNLTVERAKDLYYRDYWLKLRCPELKDDKVAQKVLDMGVNLGTSPAVKRLQLALTDCGANVYTNGKLAKATIEAANRIAPEKLLEAIRRRHAEYYIELIERKPQNAVYKNGWLKRASA